MTIFILISVLIINIPFGYWRGNHRKFSFQWICAIHIPVIISVALRYIAEIDTSWWLVLLFIAVFIAGQFIGKKIVNLATLKRIKNV